LHAVAQKLADHVLYMRRDVWESGVEVPFDNDLWNGYRRTKGLGHQVSRCCGTLFDDFLGITLQEDLAYKVVFGRDSRLAGVREMPGRVKCFRQRQVLLGNHSATNPRAQQRRHELVAFLAGDVVLDFDDAHGQPGDNAQVLAQTRLDNIAKAVVVVNASDFRHLAQAFKSGIVQLIDMTDVTVSQRRVWQSLHVAQAVGESRG